MTATCSSRYDEGDAAIIDGVMRVVAEECDALNGERSTTASSTAWFHHRNEVTALEALTRKGFVVDTMEIAARWRDLPTIYDAARAAIMSVPGAAAASAHQSHAYTDGACLYFTFAGRPPAEQREAFYVAAWDAGTRAVLANGGALVAPPWRGSQPQPVRRARPSAGRSRSCRRRSLRSTRTGS